MCDRCGLRPSSALELRKRSRPVGRLIHQFSQLDAVLERAIHALAVKGHDRVRGIAQQQHLAGDMPGGAVNRSQQALGVGEKLRFEIGNQGRGRREFARKEVTHGLTRAQRLEAAGAATLRQEQRGRKAAIGIRQCDQHEAAAGPDVQCVAIKTGAPWNLEFLVVVVEKVLVRSQQAGASEAAADGRARAVGCNDPIQRQALGAACCLIDEVQLLLRNIDALAAHRKTDLDP